MVYRVDGRRADHGSSHGTPGRDVLSDGVFSIHFHQFLKLMFRPGGLAGLKGRRRRFSGGKVFGENTGTLWVRMIFPESPAGAPTLPHREKAFDTFARQFLQALRCWNIRGAGFSALSFALENLFGVRLVKRNFYYKIIIIFA